MAKGNDIDLENISIENENVRKSELTREKQRLLWEVILEKKQSLHTLCEGMRMYPQYLQNVRVIDKKAIIENEAVQRKNMKLKKC